MKIYLSDYPNLIDSLVINGYPINQDNRFNDKFIEWYKNQGISIIVRTILNYGDPLNLQRKIEGEPHIFRSDSDELWYRTSMEFQSIDDFMVFKLTWL